MQEFPPPHALDANRLLVGNSNELPDDADGADVELLERALRESCDYAGVLWNTLAGVRRYLVASLPSDPRSPGPHPSTGAAPTGPDDETGWANWIAAYASVTSALCGPQGDSGLGLGEARQAAQRRRTAPNLRLYDDHLARSRPADEETAADDPARVPRRTRLRRGIRAAVLVVLVIRGLRPRHRSG